MHPALRVMFFASITLLILIAASVSDPVIPRPGEQNTAGVPDPGRTFQDPESSFSLTVVPVTAVARPGDPVDCTVTITPRGEFHEPVFLELEVNTDPVFRGRYFAGVMNPPFPKTYSYRVVVPPKSPAPLIVQGTLTAEGGGHREVVELELSIVP